MDARKGNIYEILNGNKQFVIPVYQRFYSWDIEQCRRLWGDIVAMQKEGKQGHFVGSIVNITLDRMVDDAQAIFESLNSTGKELTESDLIRNYVLMGLVKCFLHNFLDFFKIFAYE